MRILITNNTLAYTGGSESYVLDMARALHGRGHMVVAYSSVLGGIAKEIRAAGVAVIDNLHDLTERPDVIHGHHHLDIAAAALRFPDVPIVHACHGWLPWQEAPLYLPSSRRFVSVARLTREYLVTSRINPERIAVIPNFVDLGRFRRRQDKAVAPRRVLAFGSRWNPSDPAFQAVARVCQRRGLEFLAVGSGMGNSTDRPEDLLPSFDVVFALGRSALEAQACGCAVVVADPQGMDGPVTTQTWLHQRDANFGLALIVGKAVTDAAVEKALDNIDFNDAAEVSDMAHQHAGLDAAVDLWEEQYRLAIAEGPASLTDTLAALPGFFVQLKKLVGDYEFAAHDLQIKIDAHKRAAQEAVARLNAIEQSTMWRALSPVRGLLRYVPAGLRRFGRRVLRLT